MASLPSDDGDHKKDGAGAGTCDDERWAPVGFDDNYEISTHGRIFNVKTKAEIRRTFKQGYLSKTFGKKSWRIARLVLQVFDRPPEKGENAIYLDKDTSNVRLSNLRWSSNGNPNRTPAKKGASKIGWTYSDPNARVRSLADIIDCDGGLVYSDGRVKLPSGKERQANEHHHNIRGYTRVKIVTNKQKKMKLETGKKQHGEPFDIHRLVAKAFLPAPDFDKAQVDHVNGKIWDNRVENLEWVNNQVNNKRAHQGGGTGPHQKKVRLYEFDEKSAGYTFKKEYANMTVAGDDNPCTDGAVRKSCRRVKDDLSKARKNAKYLFFKSHVFRYSDNDDLAS